MFSLRFRTDIFTLVYIFSVSILFSAVFLNISTDIFHFSNWEFQEIITLRLRACVLRMRNTKFFGGFTDPEISGKIIFSFASTSNANYYILVRPSHFIHIENRVLINDNNSQQVLSLIEQ